MRRFCFVFCFIFLFQANGVSEPVALASVEFLTPDPSIYYINFDETNPVTGSFDLRGKCNYQLDENKNSKLKYNIDVRSSDSNSAWVRVESSHIEHQTSSQVSTKKTCLGVNGEATATDIVRSNSDFQCKRGRFHIQFLRCYDSVNKTKNFDFRFKVSLANSEEKEIVICPRGVVPCPD